jgi:hypothetical protein
MINLQTVLLRQEADCGFGTISDNVGVDDSCGVDRYRLQLS